MTEVWSEGLGSKALTALQTGIATQAELFFIIEISGHTFWKTAARGKWREFSLDTRVSCLLGDHGQTVLPCCGHLYIHR
jgi:hypothetical protein